MFFFLSKVLLYFTYPFVWIAILLIIAWRIKNAATKRKLRIAAIGTFLFFSNSIVFDEFMRAWEVSGTTYDEVDHYDVAIVLGGMASFNKDVDRLEFRRGADRIIQAIKLYKLGKVDKILISGDSGSLMDDGLNEALQIKEYLMDFGVLEDDILVESKSKNTHENAAFTKEVLQNHPELKSKLLVTSAFHMRRAHACFENEGIECDVFTTDHYTGKRWFTLDRLFIPKISVMLDWQILTKEWFGYLTYSIMGYI